MEQPTPFAEPARDTSPSPSATPPVILDDGRHAPSDRPPIGTASELDDSFSATRQLRVDGWTAARRAAFLAALAETGLVIQACRVTGMSAASAYALRSR
ncbi:MAG: hypothetical protein LC656_07920, partial [Sphingomonadales bacterium]|nr:hypothetical protein [Sphingomonadales bacterium]